MFKVLASHFGLESTGYGRAFRLRDEIFRIIAINPNRSKCPINAERVADGRGFNFPTGNVAMRPSSVHTLIMYTLCSLKSPNMQLRAPYPYTTSAFGELVFHVFGAIAHFERRLISVCTKDEKAAAQKHGRIPGRPPIPPETISALQDLVTTGKSVSQAAKHLGIGRSTAYKAIRNAMQ